MGTLNNSRIEFELSGVKDPVVQDVLQSVRNYLRDFAFFNGDWKFFTLTFPTAMDNLKVPHGFKFTPTDILETAIIGDAGVIWNYDLFDSVNLDVTISSPCTFRGFIGRMNA